MRRRSRSDDNPFVVLRKVLRNVPVWLGPTLALLTYVCVAHLVPLVLPAQFSSKPFTDGAGVLATVLTIGILLVWVMAEVDKWFSRRLLDSRDGLSSIQRLSWSDFEELVAEAYRRKGYRVIRRGGAGPDGGVDLVLTKGAETVLVQCKQWKAWKVGVKVVRELLGAMTAEGATAGVVVCSRHFTKEARSFVENKSITLLDGSGIQTLVANVQLTRAKQATNDRAASGGGRAEVRSQAPVSVSAASDSAIEVAPRCPVCNGRMVVRTARRGAHAGSQFWGCEAYPRCRGIRHIA